MAEYHRLPDKKYSEAEFLLQTIEMAKAEEEYELDLCTSSPTASDIVDLELVHQDLDTSIFSLKVVEPRKGSWKSRHRPHRRYTVSHGSPPAPPSTPTSLTANNTPAHSPTASNMTILPTVGLTNFYSKYKRKQQRTEVELADLFNGFNINGNGGGSNRGGKASKSTKLPIEHGITAASRIIRKQDITKKIFKLHGNTKEFLRELNEEDSISAPEYEFNHDDLYLRRLSRSKPMKRNMMHYRRENRRTARGQKDPVDVIADTFDATMSFNDD